MIQGITRWDRKRKEDIYTQSNMLPIVQVINKKKTSTVWQRHEDGGRVNAEGCNEVEDEGKETERKTITKVAKQHR